MAERGVAVHTFEAEMSDELTVRHGEEVGHSATSTCQNAIPLVMIAFFLLTSSLHEDGCNSSW